MAETSCHLEQKHLFSLFFFVSGQPDLILADPCKVCALEQVTLHL